MHLFHEFVTLLIIGLAKTNWCFVLKEIDVRNDSSDWSYFMLVQRWPQSSCEIVNASGHSCAIPSNVNGWIIHGMWPSGLDTYPQYCQNWTFVLSQVADLEQELLQEWPNIYLNETFDSLWKHEYEKHGTCAASDRGFEHEHDYFQQTLDIIKKYDIQSVLENHGIVPRQKPYEASYLNDAVRLSSTKTRCLWCGHVKGIGQVLSQSYVCLDKKLQQIDCPACEKPCINDSPVFYQPIQYSTVV